MTWHIAGQGDWHPATEDTVAGHFAQAQAGRLRYCHEARAWFVYDGGLWRRDRTGVAAGRMREVARELCTDPGGARTAASGKPGFVAGALRLAAQEPGLAVTAADWDVDPWRLGTPEGPVDLRGGAAAAADPCDGISRATAVAPAMLGAPAPAWRRFLEETFAGDAALISFVQRCLGYALTGATSERVVVLGCGTGAGKSTLLSSVLHVMGDYAAVAELAALGAVPRGTRLVGLAEGESVGSAKLARIAGGATFKLIAMAAAPPRLAAGDAGPPLLVVPFRHRPARRDRALADTLQAEAPAILRWMIEGALAWQVRGLDPPRAVGEATADALDLWDGVDLFLAERCDTSADLAQVSAGDLWRAWCAFAAAADEPAGPHRAFAQALVDRGFARDRTSAARLYRGIRLREAVADGDA